MRPIKTKVIWAALIVPADKEVVLIEPVRILAKSSRGDIETITVPAHSTSPIDFLEKVADLVDKSQELLQ